MFLELFVMGEMQVQRSKSCLFKHHLAPTTCTAERLEIIKHILVFQTCIALYKELFVNKWLVFVNMWKHMKCICCVLPCAFIQVPWPIKLMQDLLCFSFPLPSLFLFVGAEWRPPVCLDIPHSLMQLRVRLCEECALECLCYDGPSTQLGHNLSALSNESRVQNWLCLSPCHRCEETLILELPVFKSIPVLQSPAVSSELWHSLGGCQGAFAMLWCNGLTHTLCMQNPSSLPIRLQGSIYLYSCWAELHVNAWMEEERLTDIYTTFV